MITNLSLHNFKCFKEETSLPFRQINILYGKNGRGKSTFSQALLMLAQSMKENNEVTPLLLKGDLVDMGLYNELYNAYSDNETFSFTIQGDSPEEKVKLSYEANENDFRTAKLYELEVNGMNRVDEKQSMDADKDFGNTHDNVLEVGSTSDVSLLQGLKSVQYVSANRLGPRNYSSLSGASDVIGVNGEYLINVLEKQGEEFRNSVRQALSEVLDGAALITRRKDEETIELRLNSEDGDHTFRPIHVGFGYSYVLPVIVAALIAKKNSMMIVENPEAHLHPGAQSRLMEFLIAQSLEKNLQLVLETHSDHVVNGLRISMRNQTLTPDDAVIHYFEHKTDQPQSTVEHVYCDKNGNLSQYPDDFLDEWTKQMFQLV